MKMVLNTTWWRRPPDVPAFRTVADLRNVALETLRQRPDLCVWQEKACVAGRHVTAYCLLTDKLEHLELALGDDRFDELNVAELADQPGRDLLYFYETFTLHADQLLRELDYLRSPGRRQPDGVTKTIDGYVNTTVKHRAESRSNSVRPYDADHHAALSFADFEDDPQPPGLSADGETWGVPSLIAVATHICGRVTDFDAALAIGDTRAVVENQRSAAWSPA